MTQLKIIMALWWAKWNPAIAVIMSVKLVCDGYNLGHRRWLHAAWIRPPISRVSSRENLWDLMCTYSIYIHTVSLRKFSGPQIYLMYIRTLKSLGEGSHMHPQNLHAKISGPRISCVHVCIPTWKSLGHGSHVCLSPRENLLDGEGGGRGFVN